MLTQDNGFYQKFENYDVLMNTSAMMIDFYNFYLGFDWVTEQESQTLQNEINSYKCYDV
jgi:hypothetical protein